MDSGNLAWVLVCAALVLFMTPGLAFFYGGMVRSKNVLNMLMMNFWCLLVIPVLWVVVGYSLAQSPFQQPVMHVAFISLMYFASTQRSFYYYKHCIKNRDCQNEHRDEHRYNCCYLERANHR